MGICKREEAIEVLKDWDGYYIGHSSDDVNEALNMAIKALEQEPCEDAISRQAVLDLIADYDLSMGQVVKGIHALPPVTPQEPRCKECKWWKDSDGEYRRGCGAESQCPINRREVFEGNGYCFLFEPQESEDNNGKID